MLFTGDLCRVQLLFVILYSRISFIGAGESLPFSSTSKPPMYKIDCPDPVRVPVCASRGCRKEGWDDVVLLLGNDHVMVYWINNESLVSCHSISIISSSDLYI